MRCERKKTADAMRRRGLNLVDKMREEMRVKVCMRERQRERERLRDFANHTRYRVYRNCAVLL